MKNLIAIERNLASFGINGQHGNGLTNKGGFEGIEVDKNSIESDNN